MFAPARMPVVAGKKTANTPQKSVPEKPSSTNPGKSPHHWISWVGAQVTGLPKMLRRLTPMTPMIRYWVLKARSALFQAMPNRTARTTRSMRMAGWVGKIHCQPSRKPMTYIATPRGRVR